MTDSLQVVEEKTKFRLGDFQFFAKKKEEDDQEEEEELEEEEEEEEEKPKPKRKSKSGEDAPAWAQEIIGLLKPKAEEQQTKQKVPVPEAPIVEDEEEEEPPKASPLKSFLSRLW
ncbi:virion structural protein [Bacillus phage AP50]|uniref:Capsid protein n=1 Tax=Bacillus phage AP50 TaxID=2880538 RepID=B6RT43_9VIRU|nr:virion structural protein [Bacillus phage AP50]ACB54910.1 capsid protein [Bacillus phage AP50]